MCLCVNVNVYVFPWYWYILIEWWSDTLCNHYLSLFEAYICWLSLVPFLLLCHCDILLRISWWHSVISPHCYWLLSHYCIEAVTINHCYVGWRYVTVQYHLILLKCVRQILAGTAVRLKLRWPGRSSVISLFFEKVARISRTEGCEIQ